MFSVHQSIIYTQNAPITNDRSQKVRYAQSFVVQDGQLVMILARLVVKGHPGTGKTTFHGQFEHKCTDDTHHQKISTDVFETTP